MPKIIKKINTWKYNEDTHFSKVLKIEELALSSGFYKKAPQKITATNMIGSFWEMIHQGKNSLRNWALQMGVNSSDTISKQAIHGRLGDEALVMVESILRRSLDELYSLNHPCGRKLSNYREETACELKPVLGFFNNIIIQDSTSLALHDSLLEDFPGSKTPGREHSGMRIQASYNLSRNTWLDFFISAYKKNDQSHSAAILKKLEKRDLIIRDLGYFVLDTISEIIENQFIITKWNNATLILDKEGNRLDLLRLFDDNIGCGSKEMELDMPILLSKKKKIPMRMAVRRLPKAEVEKRIAEAKKHRSANTNHGEEYYALLKYEIYLTNIPQRVLNVKQIAKMYGLRWYIEIIFKAWKSFFNLKNIWGNTGKVSSTRVLITIYLFLIQCFYLMDNVYKYIRESIEEPANGIFISILKFKDLTVSLLTKIIGINELDELKPLMMQFKKHAVYEQRKDRINMKKKFQYFYELNYVS